MTGTVSIEDKESAASRMALLPPDEEPPRSRLIPVLGGVGAVAVVALLAYLAWDWIGGRSVSSPSVLPNQAGKRGSQLVIAHKWCDT